MFLLSLVLAPTAALVLFFYLRDKYEKEPPCLLIKTFALGFIAVIPAAIIESVFCFWELPVFKGNLFIIFINTLFIIALTEEAFKFLVVRFYAYPKSAFNEHYDGIIYSVMAALGFATLENAFYVSVGGFSVGLLRAVLAVPGHALWGVIMGYYLGMAKFNKSKRGYYTAMALVLPVIVHGLYDFFLFTKIIVLMVLVIPFMIFCWIFTFKITKRMADQSPFKEKPQQDSSGITTEDYKK